MHSSPQFTVITIPTQEGTIEEFEKLLFQCSDEAVEAARETIIRTLGEIVRAAREKSGHSVRDLARRIGQKRQYVHDIESGKKWPNGAIFARLLGSMRELYAQEERIRFGAACLRAVEEEIERRATCESQEDSKECVTNSVPPPAPTEEEIPEPEEETPSKEEPSRYQESLMSKSYDINTPFHIALYQERKRAGMTCAEIASLVGVTDRAVESWESNRNIPTWTNYKALLGLFPELDNAYHPPCRDIPTPPGKTPPKENMADSSSTPVNTPATGALRGALNTLLTVKKVRDSADYQAFKGLLKMAEADGLSASELCALLELL